MTARKLTPLSRKHHPSPTAAMAKPATAGPTTRAALKIEEFNAMAFIRSSFPTMSLRNACRMGTSKALTILASILHGLLNRRRTRRLRQLLFARRRRRRRRGRIRILIHRLTGSYRQRQRCQQECQDHRGGLCPDHALVLAVRVRHDAAHRRQEKDGDLIRESEHAEQRRRAGQPVDQPQLRCRLHPRPDERGELPGEKEPEVAVLKCAPACGQTELPVASDRLRAPSEGAPHSIAEGPSGKFRARIWPLSTP